MSILKVKNELGQWVGIPAVKGDTGPRGVSGVYVGNGTMPEGYNVQIDPDGTIPAIENGSIFDTVIETQADFDSMTAAENWNGAENILLACDLTLTAGFTAPATVKSIVGLPSTIIFTIAGDHDDTATLYCSGASIKNINFRVTKGTLRLANANEVRQCFAHLVRADVKCRFEFYNSSNVYNCSVTSSAAGMLEQPDFHQGGFTNCRNIIYCFVSFQDDSGAVGFYGCEYLLNCNATASTGFSACSYLTNCYATTDYAGTCYYNCSYMSVCIADTWSDYAMAFAGSNIYCAETCVDIGY
jgi:hypothetical protein